MSEVVKAILLGPFLWLAGAIVFDWVHWALHGMLRSRFRALRLLAHPHVIHHEWIDRDLVTNWQLRTANIWCHLVLEYVTQLVFTGIVALVLAPAYAIVLGVLQTIVFLTILRDRGRDVNHRPPERLDAHPAGWSTPPSYHLLHHVWPDAYYSAYTKLVDLIVGGGAQVAERRFALRGPDSALARALREEIERRGGEISKTPEVYDSLDVLILVDPAASLPAGIEPFIDATRDCQLPPEVWALRAKAAEAYARHYVDDPRVDYRSLLVTDTDLTEVGASAAARRALFWIRRDSHFISLSEPLGWASRRRFFKTKPLLPEGVEPVRHRVEFAASPVRS